MINGGRKFYGYADKRQKERQREGQKKFAKGQNSLVSIHCP